MTIGIDGGVAGRTGPVRTIPSNSDTEAVTASSSSVDLASFGTGTEDLRGKWVFFTARGGAVTMRRIATGATPTLTAGQEDFTLADGETEEFFVPTASSGGYTDLRVIGSGSCNLDAAWSDD